MATETLPATDAPDLAERPPATLPGELVDTAVERAIPQRQLVIIDWSGSYDKVMPTLIMSSVAAASGYRASVFLAFVLLALQFVAEIVKCIRVLRGARAGAA